MVSESSKLRHPTLEDCKNQAFKIRHDQKFNIDGARRLDRASRSSNSITMNGLPSYSSIP